MISRSEVKVGQVWTWLRPDGKRREMLVQRIQNGPGWVKHVCGINPQTGRPLKVLLSTLERGLLGARLERVIEGYTWTPVPATKSARVKQKVGQ